MGHGLIRLNFCALNSPTTQMDLPIKSTFLNSTVKRDTGEWETTFHLKDEWARPIKFLTVWLYCVHHNEISLLYLRDSFPFRSFIPHILICPSPEIDFIRICRGCWKESDWGRSPVHFNKSPAQSHLHSWLVIIITITTTIIIIKIIFNIITSIIIVLFRVIISQLRQANPLALGRH